VHALLDLPADTRPTAIFTGNNRHTLGALRALRGREHEVALVGFDDFELADLLAMPTTVVRHDSFRLGAEAAALAFARLDGSKAPPQRIVLDTELVVRGSGEVAPRP
jgi:LacI family transcriptional regulator